MIKGRFLRYAFCLSIALGVPSVFAYAQGGIVLGDTKQGNLTQIFALKAEASATEITFTLSPEPLTTDRQHYPIIFIEWHNGSTTTQQMINLAYDMTFTLPLGTNKLVRVYGEYGVWSLKANEQKVSVATFYNDDASGTTIKPAFRAIELNGNALTTPTFDMPELRLLSMNWNKIATLDVANLPALKVLELSGNKLSGNSLTGLTNPLAALDLSFNKLRTAPNVSFVSGEASLANVGSPYTSVHSRRATEADSLTMADNTTYQSRYLDVSHNALELGNIPPKPSALPAENYLISYQERFDIRGTFHTDPSGVELYDDGKTPVLMPQLRTTGETFQGIASSPQPVDIKLYLEKDAATDEYAEVSTSDYTITTVGGKKQVNILRHPTDDPDDFFFLTATPAAGTLPTEVATTAKNRATTLWTVTKVPYKFQSVEATTPDYTATSTSAYDALPSLYDRVVDQPAGTSTALAKSAATLASTTADASTGDGTTRAWNTRFYRSNVVAFTATEANYWHGTSSSNWSDPENWTLHKVPVTTWAELELLPEKKRKRVATIQFATAANNHGSPAIRDLVLDEDRYVSNYINHSERGKTISVPAGLTLYQFGNTNVGGTTDVRLRLRAAADAPNGSYKYVGVNVGNAIPKAEVEFYSKASDGNLTFSQTKWQYFAYPFVNTPNTAIAGEWQSGTTKVRRYNRSLTDQYDNKWEYMGADPSTIVAASSVENQAYQITQARPTLYRFRGTLYFQDAQFKFEGTSSPTVYQDMNLFANPYVAAMPIASLAFPSSNVDKVVYLFNTGSREQWLAGNGGTTPNDIPGSYTAGVPTGLSGYLATMPKTIPSLSAFMVKASGSGTITFPYSALAPNTEVNRARLAPDAEPNITSLTIDLLNLKDSVAYDRLWLVTAEGTSKAYDNGYDAEKFVAGNMAQLYAMGEKNYQVLATDNIHGTPLALTSGPQERQLALRFRIERPEFNVNTYYIDDHFTGTTTVVHDGDTYTFTAKPTDALHRFTVRTSNVTAIAKTQAAIEIVPIGDRRVEVRNHTTTTVTAKLYDVKGILLDTITIGAGEKVSTDVDMPGMYLVQATNGTDKADARLLLK